MRDRKEVDPDVRGSAEELEEEREGERMCYVRKYVFATVGK